MGEIMLIGALLLVGTSIYLIVHIFLSANEGCIRHVMGCR